MTSTAQSLENPALAAALYLRRSVVPAAKERFDTALVRYDGWFLVFVAVLIGLGATLLAGMAVWCVAHEKGRFSGSWRWASGIAVDMECVR